MAAYQGRPAYLQIADDLRARIIGGELRAGDRLPTEAELMADYGVSRIVVRNAVDLLRSEGLVSKQQGRGTFVRNSRPVAKRIVGHLYSERATRSPFAAAAEAAGQTPEWEYQCRRTTATAAVAERLALRAGDPVMSTHYRFFSDDEPVMLSTSHEPLAITAGTPVEHPEGGPVTGVVARMDSIGVHITSVTEDVTARAARPLEADVLRVPAGVPVFVITRTYFAGAKPVETADIVVSSERYTLSYTVPIPPRP